MSVKKKILGGASVLAGLGALGTIKKSRITGDVLRYHNTSNEAVPSILEEGIKAKYSEDPENLTNQALKDIPMSEKKGLVYLAKKKDLADSVGAHRARKTGKLFPDGKRSFKDITPEEMKIFEEESRNPKHSKTLTVHLKYGDVKRMPRENNPELEGNKTPEDILRTGFRGVKRKDIAKKYIKSLNEDTHTYRGDIGPEHIEESPHYKKNSIREHIKENPGTFAKEIGKGAAGLGLIGYGLRKIIKK